MRRFGALVGALVMFATAPGRVAATPEVDEGMRALQLVPISRQLRSDIALTFTDGRVVRLGELYGQTVILNFWATWCVPCKEEMPAIERLWQIAQNRGVMIVGVAADATARDVTEFVARAKVTFPIVVDAKREVFQAFGVRVLPTTFVVAPSGRLVGLALGPRAWDGAEVHALLDALRPK